MLFNNELLHNRNRVKIKRNKKNNINTLKEESSATKNIKYIYIYKIKKQY